MRRAYLPSSVSSEQLDDLFQQIIKLEPRREVAVRLRLGGYTCSEIVKILNGDKQSEESVYPMWVYRCYKAAERKLYRFLGIGNEKDDQTNRNHSLYGSAEHVWDALYNAGHGEKQPPVESPQRRRKRIYLCPHCGYDGWLQTYGAIKLPYHRFHICLQCRNIVHATERILRWQDIKN